MTNPINGSENISPNTSISWNEVEGARGYFLLVGTTIGGRDLIDRLDVGNVLTYQPTEAFPENTIIYVKITVYFFDKPDMTCLADKFTTGLLEPPTNCTHSINPVPDFFACDTDLDNFERFDIDIEALERQLLGSQTGLEIRYYDTAGNLLNFTDSSQHTATSKKTIAARAIDSNGCYKETTFQLILVKPPIVTKIDDIIECDFYILPELPDIGYKYFTNTNGNGTEFYGGDRITESQTLYIYAEEERCTAEAIFNITIDPALCSNPNTIEDEGFPKFFTPNGDGVNDFWPQNDYFGADLEAMHIFNRYGALVFQITENSKSWDGNLNGRRLPSSTYWYIAVYKSGKESRGYFSLKR